MQVTEKQNLTAVVRDLWADFFPHKNTDPARIAAVVQNKDWIRDSLTFYGWAPIDGQKLDINIIFVDGGAILYHNVTTPCALISVNWSEVEPSLKFTYVDNRPQ